MSHTWHNLQLIPIGSFVTIMGIVYGRMNFSGSKPAVDHTSCNPSKAKPENGRRSGNMCNIRATAGDNESDSGSQRSSNSEPSNQPRRIMTRQLSRSLARQQRQSRSQVFSSQGENLRRSARLNRSNSETTLPISQQRSTVLPRLRRSTRQACLSSRQLDTTSNYRQTGQRVLRSNRI